MAIYKLGEICKYIEGYTNPLVNDPNNFSKEGLAWLKVSEIKHGETIRSSSFHLSNKSISEIKNDSQIFKKGSIVWSKSGTVGLVSILGIEATANRGILNLMPNEEYIMKKYLFYLLISMKDVFQKDATGAVLKHLYGPELMKYKINVPQIYDQQKIIDIIEPIEILESKTNDLKEKLNAIIKKITSNNDLPFEKYLSSIKNKPLNTNQISAKAMSKRNPTPEIIEHVGTYKTNTFNVEKGTLLINTIRTYLNKFAISPRNLDANGTLAQFVVDKSKETAILSNLLNDEFWNEMQNMSQGTKMPVVKKKDILNFVGKDVKFEIDGIFDLYIKIWEMTNTMNEIKLKLINTLIN